MSDEKGKKTKKRSHKKVPWRAKKSVMIEIQETLQRSRKTKAKKQSK